VKVLAERLGLPVRQPRKVRGGRMAALLTEHAPDLAIVAAYGRILPPDALAAPRLGCLNVHASLLPRHRGAAPIHRAILAGDRETGVCLMRMDEGLDTGAVWACRPTPIAADDTAETLHDRLAGLGAALLLERLPAILAGELAPAPQDDAAATLAPPLQKEEGQLDWSAAARAIGDRVRGLHPWPGTYTFLAGRRLKVFPPAAAVRDVPVDPAPPGTVLAVEADALVVACGDGAVRLREVQPENRKRMTVAEFRNGHVVTPGIVLG
jgi:methionyl-tRNA formyltransferase